MLLFLIFSLSLIRLPAELSCLESMMPLHSAIATARLRSILAAESQSWGMVPLGKIFCNLSPPAVI